MQPADDYFDTKRQNSSGSFEKIFPSHKRFHSFMLSMEVQCTAQCCLGLDPPKQGCLVWTSVWRSISLGTRCVEFTSESVDKRLIWLALFILVNQGKWVNQVKREARPHWLTHSSTHARHLIISIKICRCGKEWLVENTYLSVIWILFIQLDQYWHGIYICSCHHYLM